MPLIAAAAIGAAGSIGSGVIGSKSSKSAAAKQQAAALQVQKLTGAAVTDGQGRIADNATNANTSSVNLSNILGGQYNTETGLLNNLYGNQTANLKSLYGDQTANLDPYLAAGRQGVNSLAQAVAPGGELSQKFAAPTAAQAAATPGEQFMMQQGTQAVSRSAAAHGGLNTGATLQALTQYGQGLASTSYQQAYNNSLNAFQTNHQNTLSGLLALTGVGQNATSQFNQAAQNYGGQYNQAAQNYGGQYSQDTQNFGSMLSNNTNFNSGLQMNAAGAEANLGMQGAQLEGNAITGGANAQAAGTLGAGQSWKNTLGGLTNIATGTLGGIFGGGGDPTGSQVAGYAQQMGGYAPYSNKVG